MSWVLSQKSKNEFYRIKNYIKIPEEGTLIEYCNDPDIRVANCGYSVGKLTFEGLLKIGDTKHEEDGYVNFTGLAKYWRLPGEKNWEDSGKESEK